MGDLPNCQTNLDIALHALSLLFCNFINTTIYHWGRYEPSSLSTEELNCYVPSDLNNPIKSSVNLASVIRFGHTLTLVQRQNVYLPRYPYHELEFLDSKLNDLLELFTLLNQTLRGGAAVAQWICLRIPSYRPRFKSQAHRLWFYQIIFDLWHVEKTKISNK